METKGLIRRVAEALIARPLAAVGVRRHHLATVRLLCGVATAALLALGPAHYKAGAILFLAGFILERANTLGNRYTFIADGTSNALAFTGLGIGLRFSEYGLATIAMGALAGAAIVVIPWLIKRLAVIDGKRSAEFDGVAGLDADDVLLVFPWALLAGWQENLLLASAVALPTFALALFTMHYRKFSAP